MGGLRSKKSSAVRDGTRSSQRSRNKPSFCIRILFGRREAKLCFPWFVIPTVEARSSSGRMASAFLWAADRVKGPDVQFNHVWRQSADARCYTALWNLCCTPAFLAKACDAHPVVTEALRYRAEHLYGYRPADDLPARKPDAYDDL